MGVAVGYHNKIVEGNTALTLSAGAGESLLVTGIKTHSPAGSYATLSIDKATVGYFRVAGSQGAQLWFPNDDVHSPNLLAFLLAAGIFTGYPVGEGQTFLIEGVNDSDSIQAVEYILAEAGVYMPTQPNGSLASEYLYVSYGRLDGTAADGDHLYNVAYGPAQFPDFPFGAVAPQGKVMRLHGICFTEMGYTTGSQSHQHETAYLKLIRDRVTLFDEDRNGLYCRGNASTSADALGRANGYSVLGGMSIFDLRPPFMFDEPLDFQPGEELLAYLTSELIAGTINLPVDVTELALIFQVIAAGGGRF